MSIYAISDFHLSLTTNKPMDIFGDNWAGHWDKICSSWRENITEEDIVLSAGDTSWGISVEEAYPDLKAIDELPGKKFVIRGNHDYWWSSYAKINALDLKSITFIQNNAFVTGDYVVCGTRGWTVPERTDTDSHDNKIFERELIRLKLTLDSAVKVGDGRKIILLIHYPPFNSEFADSKFTDLIAQYDVAKVVYGHLHGNRSRYVASIDKRGIEYLLTSCDFLSFNPLKIF